MWKFKIYVLFIEIIFCNILNADKMAKSLT